MVAQRQDDPVTARELIATKSLMNSMLVMVAKLAATAILLAAVAVAAVVQAESSFHSASVTMNAIKTTCSGPRPPLVCTAWSLSAWRRASFGRGVVAGAGRPCSSGGRY